MVYKKEWGSRKKILNFLKKRKLVVSIPVIIRLKRKDGKTSEFPAKRGEEVVKWKDVLKAFRNWRGV